MAVCRRSLRLVSLPLLQPSVSGKAATASLSGTRKSITTPASTGTSNASVGLSNGNLEPGTRRQSKRTTGKGVVFPIKTEPPQRTRGDSAPKPLPKLGSKRKLNFEGNEKEDVHAGISSSNLLLGRVKLERGSPGRSSAEQTVVKEEEDEDCEGQLQSVARTERKPKRKVKVEDSHGDQRARAQRKAIGIEEESKRPDRKHSGAPRKLLEDVKERGTRSKRGVPPPRETERRGCDGIDVAVLASVQAPAISAGTAMEVAVGYEGPYPTFPRPLPEECREVRDRLLALHGLGEYVRHRSCPTVPMAIREPLDSPNQLDNTCKSDSPPQVLAIEYRPHEDAVSLLAGDDRDERKVSQSSLKVKEEEGHAMVVTGHPLEPRTVLDSLVGTILSQNTTDTNSRRAFSSLKAAFPTWEEVHKADSKAVEDAIRCGGLAEIKAGRIRNILETVLHERGRICLEYVRDMTPDQIKAELSRFKGVGPKTVACVLMFHLQHNEFPVDTHVFRISKMLGWVPASADREKAYLHLNQHIPNDVKFDLHCLLVTHGKRCPRCAKGGRVQTAADGPCPLVNWSPKLLENSGQVALLDTKG